MRMQLVCPLILFSLYAAAADAASLEAQLHPLIKSHAGTVAVAIRNLKTGEEFLHNADTPMPTASLIKFPVMVEAYRQAAAGDVNLQEMITLREEDKVPGSGILTSHFSAGAQIPLRDVVRLMIAYSDNTATNLVLDRIGLRNVAAAMEKLELPETKIHANVFRRDTSVFPDRSREFGLGSTTATETIRLYQLLYEGKLGTEDATASMLGHLRACEDTTKLAALLPAGTKIAHKGGAVSKVRCDAGIIEGPSVAFAICVLTKDNKDQSWRDDNDSPNGAYARFVAEMNRTAARLGMSRTKYKNPHGLTEPGHRASAADLLKLARAAMQLDSFRRYVGTSQRGCAVTGPGGYKRHVVWRNTNQLLAIEGFLGIKTGTTGAAGACLVSYGRRGNQDLIVVVLGAKSSPARYADTRNLFRWGWKLSLTNP